MINYEKYLSEAARIAKRSHFHRHRTGAIITNSKGQIISNGWSHVPNGGTQLRSLHAEMHAIARGRHNDLNGATIWIVTLTKANYRTIAQPCAHCAIALAGAHIENVVFSSDRNSIREVSPELLLKRYKTLKVYNGRNRE